MAGFSSDAMEESEAAREQIAELARELARHHLAELWVEGVAEAVTTPARVSGEAVRILRGIVADLEAEA